MKPLMYSSSTSSFYFSSNLIGFENVTNFGQGGDQDQKMMIRESEMSLIGSSPPRCERVRCRTCGHCEAIQVPMNPQTKLHHSPSSSEIINLDYSRGDDSTNYKPMSWKCKCGNSIYNP